MTNNLTTKDITTPSAEEVTKEYDNFLSKIDKGYRSYCNRNWLMAILCMVCAFTVLIKMNKFSHTANVVYIVIIAFIFCALTFVNIYSKKAKVSEIKEDNHFKRMQTYLNYLKSDTEVIITEVTTYGFKYTTVVGGATVTNYVGMNMSDFNRYSRVMNANEFTVIGQTPSVCDKMLFGSDCILKSDKASGNNLEEPFNDEPFNDEVNSSAEKESAGTKEEDVSEEKEADTDAEDEDTEVKEIEAKKK